MRESKIVVWGGLKNTWEKKRGERQRRQRKTYPTECSDVKSLSRVQLFATSWTVAYHLLCQWDFPGKSTGVGCHCLFQGIFPTEGSNLGLLHCRQMLLPSEPPGSPLSAEFQRIARRDKKAFLSEQCKEIEENNRIWKTRDIFRKIRDTKGTFHAKMDTIRTEMAKI